MDSPVLAPQAGVITAKHVVIGDVVSANQPMFEISDLSEVWLAITVYPQDVERVTVGTPFRFRSDSLPGKTINGTIQYLRPAADLSQGTFVAAAFLKNNPQQMLKPGLFGSVTLTHRNPLRPTLPFIPDSALQRAANDTFVFMPTGKSGEYLHRSVQLAERGPGGYWVASGLHTGESVVDRGGFLLKSTWLKNQVSDND